jgi:hypothetical protein
MKETRTRGLPPADKIKTILLEPFPVRKRSCFTDAMDLMEWTDAMFKKAYPSRKVPVPSYDPMTMVPIQLAADELDAIPNMSEIAGTKKLRPRLEAMSAEGRVVEMDIKDWSTVLLALCGTRVKGTPIRKHLLRIAKRIASRLAEVLGIDPPSFNTP